MSEMMGGPSPPALGGALGDDRNRLVGAAAQTDGTIWRQAPAGMPPCGLAPSENPEAIPAWRL